MKQGFNYKLNATNYPYKCVKENKKAVEDYKSGDKKAFEFLMGQIMKETQKRADFKIAREALEKLLK